jgi:hypothetical protein
MTVTPDGRYKLRGDTGLPGFVIGLCHFEPGEVDAYPGAFDHPPRRIAAEEPLFVLDAIRAIDEHEANTDRFLLAREH